MKRCVLTKIVYFGTKQHHFDQYKNEKRVLNNLSYDHCSSSSTFCTRKDAWVATFQGHLMPHLSTKQDK